MRKVQLFLVALVVLLGGCGKKETFTLTGRISGLRSDTIWVFYQQPDYKLDTIVAEKGHFDYTFTPDTMTVFSLVMDGGEPVPVFADRGGRVAVTGTPDQVEIKGTGENEMLNQIRQCLDAVGSSRRRLQNTLDSIIKANPYSYTNLYLIDKYCVQVPSPDYDRVRDLVKGLSGLIKDTPYMVDLQSRLDALSAQSNRRSLSSFSCPDKDGKSLGWSDLRNRYVLLDFWASWDSASVTEQDSLVSVLKALKKERFTVVSLSLDLDRNAWLAACDRDTTQWRQVCDFKGWSNAVVKQQELTRLPANLLVGPDRRIIARDLRGQELVERVKELIKQDKEREKEQKEQERLRKRNNRK